MKFLTLLLLPLQAAVSTSDVPSAPPSYGDIDVECEDILEEFGSKQGSKICKQSKLCKLMNNKGEPECVSIFEPGPPTPSPKTPKPKPSPTKPNPNPKPNPKPNPGPNPKPNPIGDICVLKGWTKKKCKKEKCCLWVRIPSKLTPNCLPKPGCDKEGEDYKGLDVIS